MEVRKVDTVTLITKYGVVGDEIVGLYVEFDTNKSRMLGQIIKANQHSVWVRFNRAGSTTIIQRRWVKDNVQFVEVTE